jgi:hypothetical protein
MYVCWLVVRDSNFFFERCFASFLQKHITGEEDGEKTSSSTKLLYENQDISKWTDNNKNPSQLVHQQEPRETRKRS